MRCEPRMLIVLVLILIGFVYAGEPKVSLELVPLQECVIGEECQVDLAYAITKGQSGKITGFRSTIHWDADALEMKGVTFVENGEIEPFNLPPSATWGDVSVEERWSQGNSYAQASHLQAKATLSNHFTHMLRYTFIPKKTGSVDIYQVSTAEQEVELGMPPPPEEQAHVYRSAIIREGDTLSVATSLPTRLVVVGVPDHCSRCDINGDGAVDLLDMQLLQQCFEPSE